MAASHTNHEIAEREHKQRIRLLVCAVQVIHQRPTHEVYPKIDQQQVADRKAKAEELKGQGNKAIGAKKYAEAVKLYTQAIELDPENPLYYGNR